MKLPIVYLDVCALCRPFDDQGFLRIRLETDAVNLILGKVKAGALKLAVSPVHQAEVGAIRSFYERTEVLTVLERFGERVRVDVVTTRSRAEELSQRGFGLADAAHVAFAEAIAADFVTCDDKLIKLCNRSNIATWCGDPVSFCMKENLK